MPEERKILRHSLVIPRFFPYLLDVFACRLSRDDAYYAGYFQLDEQDDGNDQKSRGTRESDD
jgi:hypothetical protein